MARMRMRMVAVALTGAALAAPVNAAETITYVYDARGRMVQVMRTGTINNGVTTTYVVDKSDNRTSKTTTGTANPPPP